MKGIVFTEFLDMVEAKLGPAVADRMIAQAKTRSNGAYTSVGTYDHAELVSLVVQLSQITGLPANELVRTFGQHLFGRFALLYPAFFKGVASSFDFLASVERYIHPEVRKLYPDAELPSFQTIHLGPGRIELVYRSSRHFEDLAEGLIQGCAAHFGERLKIQRDRSTPGDAGVRFILTQAEARAA